jgi:hypothetical protein
MESTRYAPLIRMYEVPEIRDATGVGRAHGRTPRNLLAGRLGSVCVLSSAVGLGLSQTPDGRYKACPCRYYVVLLIILPAKAETRGTEPERRAERDAVSGSACPGVPTVEVGGSGGRVEEASDGPPGRTDRERDAVRSRGGAESAGWREVAAWCHASEGVSHR